MQRRSLTGSAIVMLTVIVILVPASSAAEPIVPPDIRWRISGREHREARMKAFGEDPRERARLLEELNDAVAAMHVPDDSRFQWPGIRETIDQIRAAGDLGFEEAIPALKALEGSVYAGGWNGVRGHGSYVVRQAAQLALRQLGSVPSDLPGMHFPALSSGKAPPGRRRRAEGVEALDLESRPALDAVWGAIGNPDRKCGYESACNCDVLEWDIDASEPYTLRVFVPREAMRATDPIAKHEVVRPARWRKPEPQRSLECHRLPALAGAPAGTDG